MTAGQAFQFGDCGIMPILDEAPQLREQVTGARAPSTATPMQQTQTAVDGLAAVDANLAATTRVAERALAAPAPDSLEPGALVRAAKKRIAWLKGELRRAKKLEQELRELQRLVAAAKAQPSRPRLVKTAG